MKNLGIILMIIALVLLGYGFYKLAGFWVFALVILLGLLSRFK